ncbi:ArsR/SmtB family transcription factor [Neisseria canis]|uniref:ArsR family transcriptional regulator n=1 Tax=Neisseria canis TaxID=493 RepID=A0A3S4NI87_9NEIS|nr:metalloregulator ArsR/SmtB family transcription factor [Neisseria canis]VEF01738.1 ArsR family transcriptional regulator [Neisseria canis]
MKTITSQTANEMMEHAERASSLLKLISHPHRLMILCLLAQSERNVTEIVNVVGINQTAVSNHLAKLRAKGVVDYTRYHRILQYRITSPEIFNLLEAMCRVYCTTDHEAKQ